MRRCHTIQHLRAEARRNLPRVVFDFVDGGSGQESALARNRQDFDALRLLPRALVDCTRCDMSVELFGHRFALPFGVAPMGLANLVRPGTDVALARAAAAANIPYALSTAATTGLEEIAAIAPANGWFQLYAGANRDIVDDLIRRVEAAGFSTLMVTVDVPIVGRRIRDLENGLTIPIRPTLRGALDLARRPAWTLRALRGGAPRMETMARYVKPNVSAVAHAALIAKQIASIGLHWDELERIRARWPRSLVVKGVLHPEDAERALNIGADGIVVSNHGGRQLDSAPSSIAMLPAIRAAVGDRLKLLLDSGVRTGDDIARALAAGANFVLLGRPFLYGIAALGLEAGPETTIRILTEELRITMAHLGCVAVERLGPAHLVEAA